MNWNEYIIQKEDLINWNKLHISIFFIMFISFYNKEFFIVKLRHLIWGWNIKRYILELQSRLSPYYHYPLLMSMFREQQGISDLSKLFLSVHIYFAIIFTRKLTLIFLITFLYNHSYLIALWYMQWACHYTGISKISGHLNISENMFYKKVF